MKNNHDDIKSHTIQYNNDDNKVYLQIICIASHKCRVVHADNQAAIDSIYSGYFK